MVKKSSLTGVPIATQLFSGKPSTATASMRSRLSLKAIGSRSLKISMSRSRRESRLYMSRRSWTRGRFHCMTGSRRLLKDPGSCKKVKLALISSVCLICMFNTEVGGVLGFPCSHAYLQAGELWSRSASSGIEGCRPSAVLRFPFAWYRGRDPPDP